MTQLQCRYGLFETLPDGCSTSESLRLYGEWAERELLSVRRFVAPGATVFDLGASIGARALAFARRVGKQGRVYAVESRVGQAELLARNIELNRLTSNVIPYASGVALTAAGMTAADVVYVGDGEEAGRALRECADLIAKHRPVVVVADSQLADLASALTPAVGQGYAAYACDSHAFNPDNYRRCVVNVFGERVDRALILVPAEKAAHFDYRGLLPLGEAAAAIAPVVSSAHGDALADAAANARTITLRSVIYGLRETLIDPDTEPATFAGDDMRASERLHVVVPFYKKEELVARVFAALNAVADELRELNATVFFFNDSPDYPALQAELDRCVGAACQFALHIVRNEQNLGFIGTCNRAFEAAKRERADIVLLNSDTIVFPGALREVCAVSRLDPMIGFVSPRSNNATIATLPHSFLDRHVAPDDGYAGFLRQSSYLPRYSYVPTAVGFCLHVKWAIFAELGSFDPVYGKGYNEENDLIYRANRCGYRAVLANHAFVWHEGEQSFAESASSRAAREDNNAPILQARYPEYLPLIRAYFSSPEHQAEALVEYLESDDGKLTFAFDFSTFGAYYNGTFESGIKLLEAAVRTWPQHCEIAVYMDPAAWKFHGLDKLSGVRRLDVHDARAKVTAIVRVGQPFDVDTVERIVRRAPVVGIFMLDTISYDCGYLTLTFNHRVWRYVFDQIDVLFTNSRYTLDRIAARFPIGRRVLRRASRHSLDVTEYAKPSERTPGTQPHLFVIGNHFCHKFVRQTADAIAAAFPERKVVAVGYGDEPSPYPNIAAHESGNLSNETFERFYSDAEAVIFPSHYEGFGFPILHSIARKRPIYVRESSLYRELACGIEGAENIHYFRSLADLVDDLRENGVRWITPSRPGEKNGWDRSAREVFHALEQARATASYESLVERLRRLDELVHAGASASVVPTMARRIGLRVEASIERALRVPGVKPLARRSLQAVRRLRRRR
ncbi:hypothetical protein WS73_13915 [Burkholderia savannae]|uniref:glycosyltransferase n=1 Tax=Burkholderia savannae TaxID=1637837 RepID=UPI000763CFBE|nr:glycosyltransferase [Burkholderia savannae]KWZ45296.1 hypothetical protein WS73_13915 [Burkholderia savannae]